VQNFVKIADDERRSAASSVWIAFWCNP